MQFDKAAYVELLRKLISVNKSTPCPLRRQPQPRPPAVSAKLSQTFSQRKDLGATCISRRGSLRMAAGRVAAEDFPAGVSVLLQCCSRTQLNNPKWIIPSP